METVSDSEVLCAVSIICQTWPMLIVWRPVKTCTSKCAACSSNLISVFGHKENIILLWHMKEILCQHVPLWKAGENWGSHGQYSSLSVWVVGSQRLRCWLSLFLREQYSSSLPKIRIHPGIMEQNTMILKYAVSYIVNPLPFYNIYSTYTCRVEPSFTTFDT